MLPKYKGGTAYERCSKKGVGEKKAQWALNKGELRQKQGITE